MKPNRAHPSLSVLLTALTASLSAQTVAPANESPAPAEAPIELSKFEVSAKANRGYVTTSSMSASRIAVPITELPASLVVINEKLIADTVAVELRDTLSLVSGIQQSAQPQGTSAISMRGYRMPTALENLLPDSLRYHDPFNPDWTTPVDYSLLTRRTDKIRENVESIAGSVSDRITLADRKLILMGNLRYEFSEFETDTNATIDRLTTGDAASWTHSVGANYKIAGDSLVAFANQSTSFNTNITIDRNTGTTIPNETGQGWEAGVKALTADGRFGGSISVYEIIKKNIGQTNPDFVLGNGEPEFLGSGRERARGIEADITFKVSKQLSILANASYVDAVVLNSSNASLIGTRKTLVPRTTGVLAARYRFAGQLKGLSAGASLIYAGAYVRGHASATRLFEEGDAKEVYSAYLAYDWKRGRFRNTVRLNGTNITDLLYVGPDNNVAMGRQINLTYTIAFQ